jgi:hypothetical protein
VIGVLALRHGRRNHEDTKKNEDHEDLPAPEERYPGRSVV